MKIQLTCPCGERLAADAAYAGKQVRCPGCHAVLMVPPTPSVQLDDLEVVEEEPSNHVDLRTHDAARPVAGEIGSIKIREAPMGLAYARNHRWAAAGIGPDVQILDMREHKRAYKVQEHADPVNAVAFSPDGRRLLSADASGRLLLWDVEERRPIRWLKRHEDSISAVAITADGRHAVTGASDGLVRAWNLESGAEIMLHQSEGDAAVTCVAAAPTGLWIAAGSKNGSIDAWDLRNGKPLRKAPMGQGPIRSLAFSADGDLLTACGIGSISGNQKVWRWKVPSGTSISCWKNPTKTNCTPVVNAVVSGGRCVVSISRVPKKRSGHIAPLGASGLPAADLFGAVADLVTGVANAAVLARDLLTPDDYRFEVWNVGTGQRIQNNLFIGPKPIGLAISPSGLRVLLGTSTGKLFVFGVSPGSSA